MVALTNIRVRISRNQFHPNRDPVSIIIFNNKNTSIYSYIDSIILGDEITN